jgi:hypothetical protein
MNAQAMILIVKRTNARQDMMVKDILDSKRTLPFEVRPQGEMFVVWNTETDKQSSEPFEEQEAYQVAGSLNRIEFGWDEFPFDEFPL